MLMPNRTIYVKDTDLWQKAKKLAGKGGLSEVISNALQKYVADEEARAKGMETIRIVAHQHVDAPPERIAFRGRRLAETTADDVTVTVWETERGRFVLTLENDNLPPSVPCFYYSVRDQLRALAEDNSVRAVPHIDELLTEAELTQARTATTEIWIDDIPLE